MRTPVRGRLTSRWTLRIKPVQYQVQAALD